MTCKNFYRRQTFHQGKWKTILFNFQQKEALSSDLLVAFIFQICKEAEKAVLWMLFWSIGSMVFSTRNLLFDLGQADLNTSPPSFKQVNNSPCDAVVVWTHRYYTTWGLQLAALRAVWIQTIYHQNQIMSQDKVIWQKNKIHLANLPTLLV